MRQITFSKEHTDLLKIYFIFTVTLFHILRHVYKWEILHFYGLVGFFIISGYGCYLSLQNKEFKSFIKSRFSNIAPPYYTALAFYAIAHFFFGFYNDINWNRDIFGLIAHLLFFHNLTGYTQWTISGVLWFIGAIMQLYLLSYFFKKLIDSKIKLALSLIIAIFLAAYLVENFYGIKNLFFFGGWHVIYIAPFLAGMCLAKYNEFLLNFVNEKFKNKALVILYFLITAFATYATVHSLNVTIITSVLIFSLPALLLISNIAAELISKKTIGFLGAFSFFIYLYNYSFLVFGSGGNPVSETIICFATILLSAYVFYRINEKFSAKKN